MKHSISNFTLLLCSLTSLLSGATSQPASAQSTAPTLVSINNSGTGGANYGVNIGASISSSGRFVVFTSRSTDITTDRSLDTSGATLFVRDLQTQLTKPVDVSYNGTRTNGFSTDSGISTDGRYIVFSSSANNLVPNDNNGQPDIFVRDMATGTTRDLCVNSNGSQLNGSSTAPFISADGSTVVFRTAATNWTSNDKNWVNSDVLKCSINGGGFSAIDIYQNNQPSMDGAMPTSISSNGAYVCFNWPTGMTTCSAFLSGPGGTTLVSRSAIYTTTVTPASGYSVGARVSDDGSYVSFVSTADDLAPAGSYPPPGGAPQIFLKDMSSGSVTLVSRAVGGVAANGSSYGPSMSADGRYIVFYSSASNLVPNDINNQGDIFVYDVRSPSTSYMKSIYLGPNGDSDANGDPMQPRPLISGDGAFIAFPTSAGLIAIDRNGAVDEYTVPRP